MTASRLRTWTAGVALAALVGCGGSKGGGTLQTVVDTTFNFATSGVLAGQATRTAGRAVLRGVVSGQNGVPQAGVTVVLYRLTTAVVRQSQVSLSTVSGTDGSYAFGNVPPGSYRVQTGTQSQDVTALPDTDTVHDFHLRLKWTIMAYVDASNDLEQYAMLNINQMEMLPDSDQVKIVVLMQRMTGYDASNGNWVDARRFVIHHDNDTATMSSSLLPSEGGQAELMGRLDMGSPATVKAFTAWAQTNYPADHYLLNLWDHGSGWRPVNRAARSLLGRGILFDDLHGTSVSTPQLGDALTTPQGLDIVSMDCSLMQMAEVVYQLRRAAPIVCGSEESPPGEGYPYDLIYKQVFATPDLTPEDFARQIVAQYVGEVGTRAHTTQSAFRTAQWPAVLAAVQSYSSLLRAKAATYSGTLATVRAATQGYGSGYTLYDGYRDLVDFVDRVATATNDAQLRTAGEAVKTALNNALLAEAHSGTDQTNSHGLSVFVPGQSDWRLLRGAYVQTEWGQDAGWTGWLDALYP